MRPFRIALCQIQAAGLDDAEVGLERMVAALDEAGAAGVDLVALPECSYPAYYLRDREPYARAHVRPFAEVVTLLGDKARRHGYWIAAGLAVPQADGSLTNSGVIIAPDGSIRGRYDKSFLWHFDTAWFTPGHAFPTWDMGFARVGVLICADGRAPEIARSLALGGAEVILNLTAWVSSGRSMADLSNPQCEYLMPVRARENGVWIAAADKWGSEDGHTLYAGRSSVFDPEGTRRFCAPSDRGAVATFEIEPHAAPSLPGRRPALYQLLGAPMANLPVTFAEREPLAPAEAMRRVAVVPAASGARFDPERMASAFGTLRAQDVQLAVFAGFIADEGWRAGVTRLEEAVHAHGGALVFALERTDQAAGVRRTIFLVTKGGTHEHLATHGRALLLGDEPSPVVETEAGRTALLCADEALVPEVARDLALRGADVIAWSGFEPLPLGDAFLRARGDENRVHVAAAWHDGGVITSPDGVPLQISPEGSGIAMAATINLAHSRSKERVPHTNVMASRFPEDYALLLREG